MRQFTHILLLFLLCGGVSGCSSEYASKEELAAHVQEPGNGYTQADSAGAFKVRASLIPTDILVQQELGDTAATPEKVAELRATYGQYVYLMMELSANGSQAEFANITSREAYAARIQTLAFDLPRLVSVRTETGKLIPVADAHFPRTYGVTPYTTLVAILKRSEVEGSQQLYLTFDGTSVNLPRKILVFDTARLLDSPTLQF